jgi:hypothetical protein
MLDQMIHIHYAAETVPFILPNGIVFSLDEIYGMRLK